MRAMRSVLKRQLRRAFELGQLEVHYQPKFRLTSGALQGVEALLRWQNTKGEWVAPATFVPLLEETGMIGDVGTWLFQRTAADAAYWRQCGQSVERIAINISPLQLRRPDFLTWVLAISRDWSSCGAQLDLELTESALLPDSAGLVDSMNALADANVHFALDDFGMGYSSIDLLMRLPVRYLKFERCFISRIVANRKAAALVEAIIRVAHQIGLETIAEGVETSEQLERLTTFGCDIAQGHHFSPALGRTELLEYLQRSADAPKPRKAYRRGRAKTAESFYATP